MIQSRNRMLVTQNYSQAQEQPRDIRPITNEKTRRPGTVGVGITNKRIQGSIDSTLHTHSKAESIRFNNEEISNLMEIFVLFDKQKTGFVNEEDLLRILEIMNKDNSKVQERIEEIKETDEIASTQARFNFQQFLKIIGQVELEGEENMTQKSIEK